MPMIHFKNLFLALVYSFGIAVVLSAAVLLVNLATADETSVRTSLESTTFRFSVGTGFYVLGATGTRYIITNEHVCRSGKVPNVVKQDPVKDLCAVKTSSWGPALSVAGAVNKEAAAYSLSLAEGKKVFSSGTLGDDVSWVSRTPTGCPEGYSGICHRRYESTSSDLYSVPGSSGSPVVNEDSLLIGVVSSYDFSNTHEAGVIKFADLKYFMRTL